MKSAKDMNKYYIGKCWILKKFGDKLRSPIYKNAYSDGVRYWAYIGRAEYPLKIMYRVNGEPYYEMLPMYGD
jgi:hypothetical protein